MIGNNSNNLEFSNFDFVPGFSNRIPTCCVNFCYMFTHAATSCFDFLESTLGFFLRFLSCLKHCFPFTMFLCWNVSLGGSDFQHMDNWKDI